MFLIPRWSGEVVSILFAIDCHDREVPAWVASPRPLTGADVRTLMDRTLWARFGEATVCAPQAIQWLSDNGPQYTATASGAEQRDAETVLAQLAGWIDDSNRQAPHSALGMRPPTEYRASLELTPPSTKSPTRSGIATLAF